MCAEASSADLRQRKAASVLPDTSEKIMRSIYRAVGANYHARYEDGNKMEPEDEGWAKLLKVSVVKAKGLARKNTITGKSDPYVVLTLGKRVRCLFISA